MGNHAAFFCLACANLVFKTGLRERPLSTEDAVSRRHQPCHLQALGLRALMGPFNCFNCPVSHEFRLCYLDTMISTLFLVPVIQTHTIYLKDLSFLEAL